MALIACVLLMTLAKLGAQGAFEYDWVGGKPGFSGKIFLNAPSSASALDGGTMSDILPGSYLSGPLDYYYILDTSLTELYGGPNPNLQWNQTRITFMAIFFEANYPSSVGQALANTFGHPEAIMTGYYSSSTGFVYENGDFDTTGQWLAVPRLAISMNGTNALITWTTNITGLTLQSATNLASPVVWTNVSQVPTVVNGQNVVTNGISGTKKFYRLTQ
jgi:hypothetical protein